MARQERGSRRPDGGAADHSDDRGVYIISVAAELAGVHPQTLRIYERKGLLRPARTAGNTRRYSERDIERLQTIQRLTQEHGLNLAGVKMIVEMEDELDRMRRRMERLDRELDQARKRLELEVERVRRQYVRGEIVPLSALRRLELGAQGRRDGSERRRRGRAIPMGPATTRETQTTGNRSSSLTVEQQR